MSLACVAHVNFFCCTFIFDVITEQINDDDDDDDDDEVENHKHSSNAQRQPEEKRLLEKLFLIKGSERMLE